MLLSCPLFWACPQLEVANYRQDPCYAPIVRVVEGLLREKGFVAPVELFIRMKLLPGIGRGLETWPNFLSREDHTLQSEQGQPNLTYFADACARFGSQTLAHRL
jgi:hypothetical protein